MNKTDHELAVNRITIAERTRNRSTLPGAFRPHSRSRLTALPSQPRILPPQDQQVLAPQLSGIRGYSISIPGAV